MSSSASTQQNLAERLVVAEIAARAAGTALLSNYAARGRLTVEKKGVNDFVSEADREAEAIISDIIRSRFRDDGFLGEESGFIGDVQSPMVWCVDPLDGTTNFLKGSHNWCVSIGIWANNAPVLGVIYDALRSEMFTSIEDGGAYCNGIPIRTSDVSRLDHASVGIGHNKRVKISDFVADVDNLFSEGASFRQLGAGALMLAYTAAARIDCYFERHMWAWDAVAGMALVREAGGITLPYLNRDGCLSSGGYVLACGRNLLPALESVFIVDQSAEN